MSGSNYNTAISGIRQDGTTANGYAAFWFNESTIALSDQGEPSLKIATNGPQGAINRATAQFSDEDNQYAPSAVAPVDSEDIRRVGQELPGSLVIESATNWDQARRAIATFIAESLRGNGRGLVGDTGGTWHFELETSFRVLHLRVGDICRLSWAKWELDCLMRITAIQPQAGFGRWIIRGSFHNDLWYVDTFGQRDTPLTGTVPRDRLLRPSLPWHAGDDTAPWPAVAVVYEYNADGVASPRLQISGNIPVNSFSDTVSAPVVPTQATGLTTGGLIPAGSYYVAACGVDADGKYSAPSAAIPARVASGATGSIAFAAKWVGTAPTNVAVFAGPSPTYMHLQDWLTGAPSTITLTTYLDDGLGIPDQEFDKLRIRAKRISGEYGHAGIIGAEVASSTATTITLGVPSPGFTVDALAGYDVLCLAKRGAVTFPRLQFRITSNTADVLTVTGDDASELGASDIIVIQSRLTSVGSDWIEDNNWLSPFAPTGLAVDAEAGRLLRIIEGTGDGHVYQIASNTDKRIVIHGEWIVMPDTTTRYVIEEPSWATEPSVSTSYTNSDPNARTTLSLNVANLRGEALLIECSTLDGGGNESIPAYSPLRMIYLFGEPVRIKTITGDYDVTFDDDNLLVDSTSGSVVVGLLPAAQRPGRDLTIKHTAGTNTVTVQCPAGDTFDEGGTTRVLGLGDILVIAGKR